MTRTGIFLCTCNGNISESIDVNSVGRALCEQPVFFEETGFCQPSGIRALEDAIGTSQLDRVVVAACPARFQEKHLRGVCTLAGVNANHFALVDWREGCAWAHRGEMEQATAKAIDLIRMGIARVENAAPMADAQTAIMPHVLVIGGGIAGMTAARALVDRGIPVTLVEQELQLGGQLRNVPLDGMADAYETVRDAALYDPNIELRLNSHVAAVDGTVGSYRVEIRNLSSGESFECKVGAIIVATGAQEHRAAGLYHYDGQRVVTLEEQAAGHMSQVTNLIYILCAGSRDEHIPYCSNTCCLAALNQAIRIKRVNPETRITILFRDLYLLGDETNEEIVREARRAGIEFARYTPANPPHVDDDTVTVHDELTGTTFRIPFDRIVLATPQVPRDDAGVLARLFKLARDEHGFFIDPHLRLRPEHQIERGVYICGSAHRPVDADTAILQALTTAARAARFVKRGSVSHPMWSATVSKGLCTGCAQCVETCAFHAIEMRTPTLTLPRLQSPQTGEGTLDRALIDPFLCEACGNCVVACPSRAIEMPSFSDAQIFAQIDAALRTQGNKETGKQGGDAPGYVSTCLPVYLTFACAWSGYAAMELAGARRMNYPAEVRVIELPCSARLDPVHVLYAFFSDAERVLLALCPPNECHFGNGNRHAEARIENLRAQLAAHGIDPQRLQIARMMGDDANAWVSAVTTANGDRVGREAQLDYTSLR